MQRLGRLVLLSSIVALICILPISVGAAPIPIAPPFASATSASNTTTDASTGAMGTHLSFASSSSGEAVTHGTFTTMWTATFTGTARFTATVVVSGSVSATTADSGGKKVMADALVTGVMHVSGTDRTQRVILKKVTAECPVSIVSCSRQKTVVFQNETTDVHLRVPVQRGLVYGVSTTLGVQESGGVSPAGSGASAGAHVCLSGPEITCSQGFGSGFTGISALQVEQV